MLGYLLSCFLSFFAQSRFAYFFGFGHFFQGTDLPELQEKKAEPIKDVGLKGLVITGEETETENDLIRYSNYMSGAGSTFGGFMAGLPQDVKDFTKGMTDMIIVTMHFVMASHCKDASVFIFMFKCT